MILAGFAEVDITPEPGSILACFPAAPGQPRMAEGAHDPVMAKALVVSNSASHLCVCSLDICMIRSTEVSEIRRRVAEHVPELTGCGISIAATHSHSSPETSYLFGNTPHDPYIREMIVKTADAVVAAFRNRVPARMSSASVDAQSAFNRRITDETGKSVMMLQYEEGKTEGVYDPELSVLRFDSMDGSPKYVLVNYTAHALTLGPKTYNYTADYPGVLCGLVEREIPGVKALFVNGAAGNVHPRQCMRTDFRVMETIGSYLAKSTLSALEKVSAQDDDIVSCISRTLSFKNRVSPSIMENLEISCFRLGKTIIGFVPGELFVEFQLAFKKAMAPWNAVIAGYANGWHGYIPTKESYPQGGYGVDLCASDPPALSRTALPEGAGEQILDSLINMAGQLTARCLQ